MKRLLSLNVRILAIIVLVFVGVLVVCIIDAKRPSYAALMQHDQKYYSQVATACDAFLSKHPDGQTSSVYMPSDNGENFLPPVLRELKPERLEVSSDFFGGTNSVSRLVIMVGVRWGKLAKDGYEIIWENSRADLSLWNLTTHTEGLPDKIVFSLRKTAVSNVDSH